MSESHSKEQSVESPVKGILGSQKKVRADATVARNASKGRFKKSYKVVIFAILVILLLNTWRQWREKRLSEPEDILKSEQPQSTPSLESKTPSWTTKEEVLILSDGEVSKPIRVTGDRCIRAWGDNPDGNAFKTEVRGVNDSEWLEWGEFTKRKADGTLPYNDFGWIRFTGIESNAKVTYGFWLPNQCS